MNFSKKILMNTYLFPVGSTAPTSYTTQRLVTVSAGNYSVYTVPEDGWYKVEVVAAGGNNGFNAGGGGIGGARTQVVFLYQGQKCLLWAGAIGVGCAYPGTQTSELGGRGACGIDESGAGAGGPAISPTSAPHWEGGAGGQGSGFLAGFTHQSVENYSITAGSLTRALNYHLDTTAVDFLAISVYVLTGGGGGGPSDNGGWRAGGGGGGAFGNGGNTTQGTNSTSGPAGTWGKGADSTTFADGGRGAWAVMDFSTNTTAWGNGGGAARTGGHVYLDKVIQ